MALEKWLLQIILADGAIDPHKDAIVLFTVISKPIDI